ncbi:hypothetical protein KIW84_074749 [Lathyrus oleraceus]|uniref:DUF7745 domain-containing protein n=1 Tax=Pisum sativum TaxID=3888 RepID=A0A9D4ZX91_PEA|nr:hypothetical protein KIW84_074749 [Pisum sativum]
MATVPELKRKTCTYSFHREPLTSLIELSNLVTGGNQKFYDPELRCFTFQDYQLAPTLEEYSILLNVPIRFQVPFLDVPKEVDFRVVARALYLSIKEVSDNWKSSGDVVGLPLKYLVRMAKEEAKKGNWGA